MDQKCQTLEDYEKFASNILLEKYFNYYKTGSGDELTLKLNRSSYDRYRILPRVLRDVSQIDLSCKVLDLNLSMPIGISPTAMQKMAHPEGELANVKAAEKNGTLFILSTISTTSIEEVAEVAPTADKWFQVYIYKDREITKRLVHRAEQAGFKAIVLTVDSPCSGYKRPYSRDQTPLLPAHLKIANFVEFDGTTKVDNTDFDKSLTWNDITWLKSNTVLPVLVKGILRADDALLAVEHGVDGIIVSNHGARQLDSTPATVIF